MGTVLGERPTIQAGGDGGNDLINLGTSLDDEGRRFITVSSEELAVRARTEYLGALGSSNEVQIRQPQIEQIVTVYSGNLATQAIAQLN